MKSSELSKVSPFGPPPRLHLGLTESGTWQHPQILSFIGHFCGYSLWPVYNFD